MHTLLQRRMLTTDTMQKDIPSCVFYPFTVLGGKLFSAAQLLPKVEWHCWWRALSMYIQYNYSPHLAEIIVDWNWLVFCCNLFFLRVHECDLQRAARGREGEGVCATVLQHVCVWLCLSASPCVSLHGKCTHLTDWYCLHPLHPTVIYLNQIRHQVAALYWDRSVIVLFNEPWHFLCLCSKAKT